MSEKAAASVIVSEEASAKFEAWALEVLDRARAGAKLYRGYVYFLAEPADPLIKIGWTSVGALYRAEQLDQCRPAPLEALAEIPGTRDDEYFLHKAFGHLRTDSPFWGPGITEWFLASPPLLAFVWYASRSSKQDHRFQASDSALRRWTELVEIADARDRIPMLT